jgi:hypothetical protein
MAKSESQVLGWLQAKTRHVNILTILRTYDLLHHTKKIEDPEILAKF